MPRPPSSDPFPQFWLNIGNSQCITWRKKVMSKKKDFLVLYFFFHFYLLVFLASAGPFSRWVDCIQSWCWPPSWRWRWTRNGFFVIECSAHPSPDQVTTGYLRFSNPLSSITIQFCKSLCLMRANELCRISILSDITWIFGVNSLISTEDALRRPVGWCSKKTCR